jgi:hypothetical protein
MSIPVRKKASTICYVLLLSNYLNAFYLMVYVTFRRYVIMPSRGPSFRYSAPGFSHKSDLLWIGDFGTRPKIINFDGSGLKIANLYFLTLSPTTLKIL